MKIMKKNHIKLWLFFGVATLLLTACSPTPNIEISKAWIRPDPLWENAAGYFLVENSGNSEDYLLGIQVLFADTGSLHQSIMDGDVHKMIPVERLAVPAGGSVEFKPMSYHVMIGTLDSDLEYGEMATFILEFENSGFIEVEAELRKE